MYRFLKILIGCLFFVAIITTANAQSGTTGNLTWSIVDSTLTISGNGAMLHYEWDRQPWAYFRNSITAVVVEYGVTSIRSWAFQGCSRLTSIIIPNSVTTIGNYAFAECNSLTSVAIPNSVTSIGDYAFFYCSRLTSVTIPNSITTIGSNTFANCRSLTFVTIPNSVTSIETAAFYGCRRLGSVTIPNSVTFIGNSAFASCTSLTFVTIGNSTVSIEKGAFAYCFSLTKIINHATIPQPIEDSVFNSVNKSRVTLRVPAEAIAAYRTAEVWKDFENIEAITE